MSAAAHAPVWRSRHGRRWLRVLCSGAFACGVWLSSARALANCGNGVLDLGETCDDGNTLASDGCSASCARESGAVCLIPGTPCDARSCEVAASGGAVFLRGNYLEVGLNRNAAFGSEVAPPSGWHPRSGRTPNELGLVVDTEDTGWSGFHGDFFLPGAPEEGWSLEVSGFIGSNNRNGPSEIAGEFAAPECVAAGACGAQGGARASWLSAAPFHGVGIRKRYTLVDGGVFVLVEVSLSNTTAADLADVYYLRDIDPDNDQARHGQFATTNVIVSEPDENTHIAHVRATQDVSGVESSLSLLADDARARVTRGGFSNRVPHAVWNGSATLLQSGGAFADQSTSIAFKLALPAGKSRVFRYAYALSQDVSDALACLADADGDGAIDVEDGAPGDPSACGDTDTDTCDDCAGGAFAPHADGTDTDADGACDAGDADDDGDGIGDAGDTAAFDRFVCADEDADGCDDCAVQGVSRPAQDGLDSDGDGACNVGDGDTDGDGAPDAVEGTSDRDADGLPNLLDLDSDGDGLSDLLEQGLVALDADGDGCLDNPADVDGDGLPDTVDVEPFEAHVTLLASAARDADGDGVPDGLDFDADGDGVADVDEGHDADADGQGDVAPLGGDADGDGIDAAFDVDVAAHAALVPDSDADGIPNYRDADDDDDGLLTLFEDPGRSGEPAANDSDGDGVPNFLDADDDADGVLTRYEGADPDGDGDPSDARRSLDARIPDYLNPASVPSDADGDGLPDGVECPAGEARPDADRDGLADCEDPDAATQVPEVPTEAGPLRPLADVAFGGGGAACNVASRASGGEWPWLAAALAFCARRVLSGPRPWRCARRDAERRSRCARRA